ncbi:unnamed protein product [Symbiodinium sp. CCMP2592]|nr:unnamed protein product [Symbiodinium sp. CCMP2592]
MPGKRKRQPVSKAKAKATAKAKVKSKAKATAKAMAVEAASSPTSGSSDGSNVTSNDDGEDAVPENPASEAESAESGAASGRSGDESEPANDGTETVGPDPSSLPELEHVVPLVLPQMEMEIEEKGLEAFVSTGSTQLRQWIVESIRRLNTSHQSDMAFALSKAGSIRMATACSGTDAPVLVGKAFADAVRTCFSVRSEFEHVFSCESDPDKRGFLEAMFKHTGDVDMARLFVSTEHLAAAGPHGGQVEEHLSREECEIPADFTDLIFGFPCQDVSRLNRASENLMNQETVKNASLRTGKTFGEMMTFLDKRTSLGLPPVSCIIMENVMGLAEPPKRSGTSEHRLEHSNLDYVKQAMSARGYFMQAVVLDPLGLGWPVSRKRIYMICWPKSKLEQAGFAEDFVRSTVEEILNKLSRSSTKHLDDIILDESHPAVKDELNRSREVMLKRRAESPPKVKKHKWAEAHVKALQRQGVDWWVNNTPSEATYNRYPGLLSLTDRQLDLCKVMRVALPDPRCAIVEMSQGLRGPSSSNIPCHRASIVLPTGQQLILHRGRMVSGLEAMLLQGLHFGKTQGRLDEFSPEMLRNLAGNAMQAHSMACALLIHRAIEGQLTVAMMTKKESSCTPVDDDLFDFE